MLEKTRQSNEKSKSKAKVKGQNSEVENESTTTLKRNLRIVLYMLIRFCSLDRHIFPMVGP